MNKTPSELGAMPVVVIDPTSGQPATPVIIYDESGNPVELGGGINGISVTGTPSAGQVPTATSATAAMWQDPGSGGGTSPGVAFIQSDGDDTTGDGSPSKPFATAQKAWDVGGFTAWRLGVGSFSVAVNADVDLAIFGEGRDKTILDITADASEVGADGGDGAAGDPDSTGGAGEEGGAGNSGQSVSIVSDKSVTLNISSNGTIGGNGGDAGHGGPGSSGDNAGGDGGNGGPGGPGGAGGAITLKHCVCASILSANGANGGKGGNGGDGGSPSGGGNQGFGGQGGNGANGGPNGVITVEDCVLVSGYNTAPGAYGTSGLGGSGSSDGISGGDGNSPSPVYPTQTACIVSGFFVPS